MSIVERILEIFNSYAFVAQGWNPQEEDDYQDFVDAVGNALAPAEQGGRVDDGMLRNVLGNVIKSMRATGRSWGPTRQAQVLDTWADEIETTLEAALAQNAQEEAAVEIVEWKENASPRLRFFTKVSNLPAGTKLYTHAERARVPDGWREAILAVIDALDKATGDSDPNIDPDMTDKEVRDEYPEVWSMQQLTAMIAAPSQPAQTVDVGAIREVIHYLQDEGNACMATGDGLDAQWGSRILSMSRKLTRAISGKPL
jgi:hypothetical protein